MNLVITIRCTLHGLSQSIMYVMVSIVLLSVHVVLEYHVVIVLCVTCKSCIWCINSIRNSKNSILEIGL